MYQKVMDVIRILGKPDVEEIIALKISGMRYNENKRKPVALKKTIFSATLCKY